MRYGDQKVNEIARETGMIVNRNGRDYSTSVTVGNKEMSFEYENPEDEAYISIYQSGKRELTYGVNDFDGLREEHPEFFQD
jgi:hypothetical protein